MNKNKNSKKYSLEEMADAHIISEDVTPSERKEILNSFREERRKMFSGLSTEQRIFSSILQLKFQIEDYIKKTQHDLEFSFCFFLKEYISRLQLKNKDFAEQIGIEQTELSQLLNAHRKPNDKVLIRLEIHSNKNIDALLWYKLLEKDKEYELVNNNHLRLEEKKHVTQSLSLSFYR